MIIRRTAAQLGCSFSINMWCLFGVLRKIATRIVIWSLPICVKWAPHHTSPARKIVILNIIFIYYVPLLLEEFLKFLDVDVFHYTSGVLHFGWLCIIVVSYWWLRGNVALYWRLAKKLVWILKWNIFGWKLHQLHILISLSLVLLPYATWHLIAKGWLWNTDSRGWELLLCAWIAAYIFLIKLFNFVIIEVPHILHGVLLVSYFVFKSGIPLKLVQIGT